MDEKFILHIDGVAQFIKTNQYLKGNEVIDNNIIYISDVLL